jgi:hypothetical protein
MEVPTNTEENVKRNIILLPLPPKRRRKKTNYKKINNMTRQKLIEMVKFDLTDLNLGLSE